MMICVFASWGAGFMSLMMYSTFVIWTHSFVLWYQCIWWNQNFAIFQQFIDSMWLTKIEIYYTELLQQITFYNKPSNLMHQMQSKLITWDTGNKNTSSLLQIVLLDSVVTKTPFELEAGLLQNNNLTTVLELFYRNDIHIYINDTSRIKEETKIKHHSPVSTSA